MGAVLSQSDEERAELDAKWQAHPQMVAYKAALDEFIAEGSLSFDPEGVTQCLAFYRRWVAEFGRLPESGIHTG